MRSVLLVLLLAGCDVVFGTDGPPELVPDAVVDALEITLIRDDGSLRPAFEILAQRKTQHAGGNCR